MPDGATVTLLGQSSNGFAKVRYNGTEGWAYESIWTDSSDGKVRVRGQPAIVAIGLAGLTTVVQRRGPSQFRHAIARCGRRLCPTLAADRHNHNDHRNIPMDPYVAAFGPVVQTLYCILSVQSIVHRDRCDLPGVKSMQAL